MPSQLTEHRAPEVRLVFLQKLLASGRRKWWPIGAIERVYREYFYTPGTDIEDEVQVHLSTLSLEPGFEMCCSVGTKEVRYRIVEGVQHAPASVPQQAENVDSGARRVGNTLHNQAPIQRSRSSVIETSVRSLAARAS